MAVGAADASAAATFSDKRYSVAGQLPSLTCPDVSEGLVIPQPMPALFLPPKDTKMCRFYKARNKSPTKRVVRYILYLLQRKKQCKPSATYTVFLHCQYAEHAVRLAHTHCAQQSDVYHVCSDFLLWYCRSVYSIEGGQSLACHQCCAGQGKSVCCQYRVVCPAPDAP